MQKIIVFFAFLCFNIANFNLYIFIQIISKCISNILIYKKSQNKCKFNILGGDMDITSFYI